MLARDGAVPQVCFQVLLYPSVDLAGERPSFQQFTEGLILNAETVRWFYGFLTVGRLITASDLALRQVALSLAWHWAGG
ncbi:hypothetical protein ACFQU7_35560 [Pseudoroseomonas wenyumeiae]